MSPDDDFERRHKERMEDAKRGINAISAQEDSKGLQEAEHVLRTVVYPAFEERESEDIHHIYQWHKQLIPAHVPLADGSSFYSPAIAAELKLTFGRNAPVTLRVAYSRPQQWFEVTFSPSQKASFSIDFSQTTKEFVRLKVDELMQMAHY